VAIVDALDIVPLDPGSLCESVDRSPAAGPASAPKPSLRSSRLSVSKNRIAVKLSCPKGGDTCRGKLSLRTAGKVKVGAKRVLVTIGSASYAVSPGKSSTVRLKVRSKGRSLMRKHKSVRVRVSVTPTGGKAATKSLTLRR
jgi:hypothetical protein